MRHFLRTHWEITGPILLLLSFVSGFFTFLGAQSLFGSEGAGFMNSASAAVFSIGVTAGIFLFWEMALSIVPQMPSGKTRLLGMGITALGWPFLIALSSWLNVTAMAGNAALEMHMTQTLPIFEQAVNDAVRRAQLAEKLTPDLKAAADRYTGLAQAERSSGRITGIAGNGGIADTLEGVSRQLGGLLAQLGEAGQRTDFAAAQARASLDRMRTLSIEKGPIERRIEAFATEAEKINTHLGQMDNRGLLESIQRSGATLADSVIERVASRNTQVAAAQTGALAKIRDDLARTGTAIAGVAAEVATQPGSKAPAFERISVVRAVVEYAGSFIPFWAGGIALDLLPTLLVLYLMLAHAVAVPDEKDAARDEPQPSYPRGKSGQQVKAGFIGRLADIGAMSPKAIVGLAAAVIVVLVAINLVQAAISSPPPTRPEESVEEPGKLSRPSSVPGDNCVVMPDGVRVCDPVAPGNGRDLPERHKKIEVEGALGFLDRWRLPYAINVSDPSPLALRAVSWIVDAVGLVPNFEVVAADITREFAAYATVRGGRRYIVYDRESLTWDISNPNWIDVTIMAHEIGHHLNNHPLDREIAYWKRELEADRFAGFAVSRLGGSLENALAAFRGLSVEGTELHPPRAQRLEAVEAGWRHSEALKKQEPVTCATGWLGTAFALHGGECRMAKVCRGKKPGYRLACEQNGQWLWQDRNGD